MWVGIIAVAGVAAETGIVMVVYLDEAFTRYLREGRIQTPQDVDAAVVEGAAARVRPLVMTVATTVLGLLPLYMAMTLLAICFALVSFVGLMGVFINKVAPLQ